MFLALATWHKDLPIIYRGSDAHFSIPLSCVEIFNYRNRFLIEFIILISVLPSSITFISLSASPIFQTNLKYYSLLNTDLFVQYER